MRSNKKILSKGKPAFAFVVDGDCESWYLNMIKRNEKSLKIDIKPEIPSKKKIKDQYDKVIELSNENYLKVIWIIDFDTLNKEQREAPKGENPINDFGRYYESLKGNENIIVIINNPCLEFWFLLHYEPTSKYFENYAKLLPLLKRHLPEYEKSRRFYTQLNNDIYLKTKTKLKDAICNANKLSDFTMQNTQIGLSQMQKFFEIKLDSEKISQKIGL